MTFFLAFCLTFCLTFYLTSILTCFLAFSLECLHPAASKARHMEEGGERGEEEGILPLSKSRDPHLAGQCRKLFCTGGAMVLRWHIFSRGGNRVAPGISTRWHRRSIMCISKMSRRAKRRRTIWKTKSSIPKQRDYATLEKMLRQCSGAVVSPLSPRAKIISKWWLFQCHVWCRRFSLRE